MQYTDTNKEWIESVWTKVDKKLCKVALKSRNKLPYTVNDGVHDDVGYGKVDWWTNGFWGGMMWLMYSMTKNDEYKLTAIRSEELMDKALYNFKTLHHDVGFMWHILSGAHYKLTGCTRSCNRNLFAAASLASRYNADGGFIRAWNNEISSGWSIIDCLMNLPLLYWASNETGRDSFKRIAIKHADMALRDHIRSDGSICHIVEHDVNNGKLLKVHAGQGYSDTSCWSRGSAWAIYGMVLSYIYTQKHDYLDAAIKTADYFIAKSAQTDFKIPVDFCQPDKPVYYDSTAGVCAACGMLELARHLNVKDAERYTEAAINILKVTDESFCDYSEQTDALVFFGTERYPHESMNGVHIPIIYGDFFYVEALTKLKGSCFLIW